MNFAFSILIYLIVFLVFLYAFSKYGMALFSAVTVTALISALVLLALIPPSEIEEQIDWYFSDKKHRKADDWIVLIYLLIMTLTILLISIYVILKAYEDRHRRLKVYGEDYLCDYKDYLKFW